jgi:hypothetical protein
MAECQTERFRSLALLGSYYREGLRVTGTR